MIIYNLWVRDCYRSEAPATWRQFEKLYHHIFWRDIR